MDLGIQSPFFAPKITENGRFQVQKNGTLDAQIQKRRPLFVANYPQKNDISWNWIVLKVKIDIDNNDPVKASPEIVSSLSLD